MTAAPRTSHQIKNVTYMASSGARLHSWTAASTTGCSIMLDDTGKKNPKD